MSLINGGVRITYKGQVLTPVFHDVKVSEQRPSTPPPVQRRALFLDDGMWVDAIVGYRTWRLLMSAGVASLHCAVRSEDVWEPGEVFKARCLCSLPSTMSFHGVWNDVGDLLCHTCGVYAFSEMSQPGFCHYVVMDDGRTAIYVQGEVLLWGEVSVHEYGYRAEFAKISALYYRDTQNETECQLIELAADRYGVPIVEQPRVAW